MSNLLTYKGFEGTVEYSAEDDCLFGKILGINGLAMYFGDSLESLKRDFYDAVDFHLSHTQSETQLNVGSETFPVSAQR